MFNDTVRGEALHKLKPENKQYTLCSQFNRHLHTAKKCIGSKKPFSPNVTFPTKSERNDVSHESTADKAVINMLKGGTMVIFWGHMVITFIV